jgi:hypothetical protein
MEEVAGGIGTLGAVFLCIFVFLSIILPISVYAAQKWAYKCFLELRRLNDNMEQFLREPR